jgi:hypothetical protein
MVSTDPADGTFALTGVDGELTIATASGTPIGQIDSCDGSATIDTQSLAMKPGLYRVTSGEQSWRIALL